MRATPMVRIISAAVVLTLLTSTAVSAQVEIREPRPRAEPNPLRGAQTSLIMTGFADPAVNATIESAAREAHSRMKAKPKGFLATTVGDSDSVVREASDLAEQQRDTRGVDGHIVVITGGDSERTAGFALDFQESPLTVFIDIDQPFPCLTFDGRVDPTGTCPGRERSLAYNHAIVEFAVDQPAYLAGVIAASASRDDRLGIISGTPGCVSCNRYIQGFTLGAQSVQPEIEIEVAYLSDDDEATAFGDPDTARTFAKAFIDVYQPDVLLPVAGASTRGMIEAACEEGILAVGTGYDVTATHPGLDRCVLASITRDLDRAVQWSMFKLPDGEDLGYWLLDISDGGVALTDDWEDLPSLPPATRDYFEAALAGILSGQIDTCPTECGTRFAPGAAVEEPEPSPEGEGPGTGGDDAQPGSRGDDELQPVD